MLGVSEVQGPIADLLQKLGGPKGEVWLEGLKFFLRKERSSGGLDPFQLLADWERYFQEIHKLKVDFSGVAIPEADDDDFPWIVCVPADFSTERAYSGGKQLYPKTKWTDKSLDDVMDLSFGRDGMRESYIIRFHSNWEADEDLKNLSALAIAERKIKTGTLKERLLLGDFLFWKFRKHLDRKYVTYCAGSRCAVGGVPFVDWVVGGLRVHWAGLDGASPDLRSRVAV